MAKQEIDFVDVIADDDFGIPGGMVRKGEPFRCTRKKAKELVGTKQAHYATPEELEAQASDAGGDEGAQATATEGEEGSTEDAPAKAEAAKATKSTKASK